MRARTLAAFVVLSSLSGTAAPALADAIFTDGTFSLLNYSAGPTYVSDPSGSISYTQCATCGDPGNALQFLSASNASLVNVVTVAQALVNTGFSYNPLTQGAIASITVSVDKNISVDVAGTGFGNTFRPTIEQNGIFYFASVPGAAFTGPNAPGGTGYLLFTGSGLKATDFLSYDFTTGMSGTLNPDFSAGPMLFGLTQLSGLGAPNETLTTQYDNLTFRVQSVPEPLTLSLLGAGVTGIFLARRSRRKIGPETGSGGPESTIAPLF